MFKRLREAGVIPAGVKFQVALPTPLASGLMYVSPNGREQYLRAYERALLRALKNILDAVPHEDLSIQFDVCQEVLMLEHYFPEDPAPYRKDRSSAVRAAWRRGAGAGRVWLSSVLRLAGRSRTWCGRRMPRAWWR